MNRSPLFYPMSRGMDAEGGGAADLQTDVMRFMAILSLCLVAIFALVQSLPMAPQPQLPQESTREVVKQDPAPPEAAPDPQTPQTIALVRPTPQKLPPREPAPRLERPEPPARSPVTKAPQPAAPVSPPPASPRIGFTLRFDNDEALTRLVARKEVGLYAMLDKQALRLHAGQGRFDFRDAPRPARFHEMDSATVPDIVLDTFARSSGRRAPDMQWGVTLPAATRDQLDRFLRNESGGTLIIDASGVLRLEP